MHSKESVIVTFLYIKQIPLLPFLLVVTVSCYPTLHIVAYEISLCDTKSFIFTIIKWKLGFMVNRFKIKETLALCVIVTNLKNEFMH